MTRAKPLVALLLALILMLGSVVAAVARSEMAGATSFALCGTGPATVLLDPVGHAVQARHACPHCLATGLAAILPSATYTPEPGAINPNHGPPWHWMRPSDKHHPAPPVAHRPGFDPKPTRSNPKRYPMLSLIKRAVLPVALLAMTLPALAEDGIHIRDPYARIINGAGAVYFQIQNMAQAPDVLLQATSPDAQMTGLMNSSADANGVMKMRDVAQGFVVDAGTTRILSGGADHIMLMAVPRKYKNGQTVTLTLTFEHAGQVTVTVPVDNARSSAPSAGPTAFDAASGPAH